MPSGKYSATKLELEDYERASIKERDDIGRLEKAVRVAVEKAVKKTEEETEKRSKEAIAKNLKKAGVNAAIIAKTTGLTKAEIEKL